MSNALHVRLDYGDDGLDVELPRERTTVIEPAYPPGVSEPERTLADALSTPIDSDTLGSIASAGKRVAISVCDGTRPQPRALMLKALFDAMPHVRRDDIVVLIATGTHRANTSGELEAMLGSEVLSSVRVINHDARDRDMLVSLGSTSRGVPVWLNKHWVEADVRITTGFVEPHFFAGFSGGPKMVAPGLAGLETTMVLHDAAHVGHENATWGVTEGNPIHDDVREIARMSGVHFAFDVTLNGDKDITAAFAGELFAEHRQACETSKREAMRAVDAPFDVVVTTNSGFPLDQNLYQTVKGLSAAAKVVKPEWVDLVCVGVSRRCAGPRPVCGASHSTRFTTRAPRDGSRRRLRRCRPMAGPSAISDPNQSSRSDQDELYRTRRTSGGALRADGRRIGRRPGRA